MAAIQIGIWTSSPENLLPPPELGISPRVRGYEKPQNTRFRKEGGFPRMPGDVIAQHLILPASSQVQ